MPPIEEMDCNQPAVLWRIRGGNYHGEGVLDENGEPLLEDPYQIYVRWENVMREVVAPDGATVTIFAELVVTEPIPTNSLLWRGCLEDFLGTGSGADDADLMQVHSYEEIPSYHARAVKREVTLKKFKDTLPAIP